MLMAKSARNMVASSRKYTGAGMLVAMAFDVSITVWRTAAHKHEACRLFLKRDDTDHPRRATPTVMNVMISYRAVG